MTFQIALYFFSILLTCGLTGFLAWYAWRQTHVTGARSYAYMVLAESLLALTEVGSLLAGTEEQASFWFSLRVPFTAVIPVFWLFFALDYSGRGDWLSKPMRAALFAIPMITQVVMVTSSLHGLWLVQAVAFEKIGPFWIADTSARIPGIWYLVHTFYSTLLLVAGAGVLVVAASRKPKILLGQGLLVSLGALTALGSALVGVFNLLPDLPFNPFVPGIGFSAVCYALAIFRFQLLKHPPIREPASSISNLEPGEKSSLAVLIFIFILFAALIAAGSYFTYQNYERKFRAQVESQLSAIAALKVDELQDWRSERLADANLFYNNENFSERVRAYLENPQDAEARIKLLTWMEKIKASPEYDRVFLLDARGVEQISIPAAPEAVPAALVGQASASLDADQLIFLDFHRHSDSDAAHLSMVVPVFDAQNHQPLGTLILRINPDVYLYPFIQRWPLPSQSAETLLIRRVGNEILYLNELKFEQNAAMSLRIPLENENVPAVKAVLGQTGIVEGLDYHDVPVVADIRPVPNSPWFLVSKMNTAEVYAPLRERLWQTLLFFGALILITGAGLMLVWRQQRVKYYRGQVNAAEALRLSEEKFRLAFDTSPDSVAITRMSDGMFVSVNKGFEKISGYTREQAIGKTSLEINIWKDPQDRRNVVEGLLATGEVRNYEAPFLVQDGEIYGLMSAVLIELDGEPHILNIVRDITERKRAEKALHESEERFRRLAENAQDLIYRYELSPKRGFSYVSPAAMTITGYSPEEHYADPELGFKLVHPDDQQLLAETTQGGDAIRKPLVLRWIRKDGSMLWTEQRNVPIYAEDGTLVAIEGIAIDITERKRAEAILHESETNLSVLIENTDGSIWAVDQQYGLIVGNREFHRNTSAALGRRLEMGESVLLPGFPAEVNAEWQGLYDRALQGERFTLETQTHFLESPHYIEYHFSPICEDGGEIRGVTVYGRDITERKQVEDTLIQVNDRLALAQRLAGAGIWDWELATGKLNWSPEFFHLFGLDPAKAQATFDTWRGALHPDDVQGAEQRIDEAIRDHLPLFNEYRIVTPSGETRWIGAWGDTTYNERGEAQRMTGLCIDITERKQVDTALRESEQRFRDIMENVNLISVILDIHGNIIFANSYFLKLTGWQLEEVLGRNWFELLIPPEAEVRHVLLEGMKDNTVPLYYQNEILIRSGERRLIDWSNTLLRDAQGNSTGIAGIGVDITERKRAEDAMRESEEKFRQAFNTSPIAISIARLKGGGFISVNKNFEQMSGYSESEVIGKTAEELHLWKSPEIHQGLLKELRAKGEVRDYETPILTRSGEIYCLTSASIIEINGEPHILTLAVDITERKRAEDALLQRENLLSKIFDVLPVGIWLADKNGQLTRSNQRGREIWGAEPLVGQEQYGVFKARRLPSGEELAPEDWALARTIKEGVTVLDEMLEIDSFDGKKKVILNFTAPVFDAAGNVEAAVIINLDITERKQAEEKIKENARLLRIAGEKAKLGGWSVDLRNNLCTWSDQTAAIHERPAGYLPLVEEGISYYAPEWREKLTKVFTECAQNGILYDEEMEIITANGKRVWVRTIGEPVKDEAGKIIKVQGAFQDITERKRAEQALHESENKYRTLVQNMQVGMVAHGPDTSVLFTNSMASQLLGLSLDQMLGKTAIDPAWYFVQEDGTRMPLDEYPVSRALAANQPVHNLVLGIIHPGQGLSTWVQCDAYQVQDLDGKIQQVIVTFLDISERKRAEDALRKSQMQLQAIMDYSPSLISIKDLDGNIVLANRSLSILDAPPLNELIGRNVFDIFPREVAEVLWNNDLAALQAKAPVQSEEVVKHKDGTWHTYWTVKFPIYLQSDQPFGICAISNDITERKRAEDALRESEAFITTVLDNLPVGIAVNAVDPAVTFNYMNDNFPKFYRTTREKLADPDIFWNAVYEDADFREAIKKKILDDLASGDPERMVWVDVPITRKGEATSFITARNIPIPGKPLMISTIWDVTERKQAQEQLLKILDELKRSNIELEQFAYVASHDLQEPLRAVAGMVQLLQQRYKGQLDGRADEYIGLAVEGATRMQTLINDLLAYSRVERRGSPIKSTDANAALQSALRNLGAAIFESGAVVTNGSLPTLEADATQLTQLFQNLIGNAIKFRGQDLPNIHVEARDLGNAWQFSVSDNGIGIEPQYYERIFLVFQRLHTRRDYPGTGIGLSICKKIVERHGGRIWIESTPGQGTIFHFTIPHRR